MQLIIGGKVGDKSLVMSWGFLLVLIQYCVTTLVRDMIISVMKCDLEVVGEKLYNFL